MAGTDYIPATDDGFATWGSNFALNINLSPSTYMLTVGQAAAIQSAVDLYVAKLAIADNEMTRNVGTIADKDDAKATASEICRGYAMMIKQNSGIADADKLFIGVRPVNTTREPIDPPSTAPLLNILGATPGVQSLRVADTTTPDSKSRPFGASNLQLFLGIGTEEPLPQAQCSFYGAFTRSAIDVEFSENDDGKIATFYGRWANQKGKVGPWSLPVSMRIAA